MTRDKVERPDLYSSYNQYQMYKKCPGMIALRKIIPESEHAVVDYRNMITGCALHHVTELYVGQEIGEDEIMQGSLAEFDRIVEEEFVGWKIEKNPDDQASTRMLTITHTANLISLLREHDITPLNSLAEQTIRTKLGDVMLGGRIDIIQKRPDGLHIFDVKSNLNPRYIDDDQMRMYYLLIRSELLEDPVSGSFLMSHTLTTRKHEFKSKEINDFYQRVRKSAYRVKDDKLPFLPGRHCKYCNYRNMCPSAFEVAKVEVPKKTGEIEWIQFS